MGYYRQRKLGSLVTHAEKKRRVAVGRAQEKRLEDGKPSREHSFCSGVPDIGDVADDLVVETNQGCWAERRRVVELGVLAEGLKGCKKYGDPLQLHHTSKFLTYGLAAIYKVYINVRLIS
jgi:hypothetical protein